MKKVKLIFILVITSLIIILNLTNIILTDFASELAFLSAINLAILCYSSDNYLKMLERLSDKKVDKKEQFWSFINYFLVLSLILMQAIYVASQTWAKEMTK